MLEPKFIPYITKKKSKTKHGVVYNLLADNAPQDIKSEYLKILAEQDKLASEGKLAFKF